MRRRDRIGCYHSDRVVGPAPIPHPISQQAAPMTDPTTPDTAALTAESETLHIDIHDAKGESPYPCDRRCAIVYQLAAIEAAAAQRATERLGAWLKQHEAHPLRSWTNGRDVYVLCDTDEVMALAAPVPAPEGSDG